MSSKASKQQQKSEAKGKGKAKGKAPELIQLPGSDSAQSDSEGSEIGEEGLGKLMAALGEDGLDDTAQQMLKGLYGGDEGDESEDEGSDYESKVQIRSDADSEESEGDSEEDDISDAEENAGVPDEEDEEGIDLDEVSSVDEDAVPRQKIVIDNKDALERICDTIKLDASLPWTETLSVTYPGTHTGVDVTDDIKRETSFYKQALHSADDARARAASSAFPFTRPSDYFAEMVKSDAHMERIRQRLLDESAGIKKGEEKRREREGKKFGKQIQVEKVRERERNRKDLDEKIKGLKRKRKGGALDDTQGEDGFEVALEDAITDRPAKRARMPRTKRDEKYGRGGRGSVGWRSKQNTRESTDHFESDGRGRGRGGRGGSRGRGGARGRGASRGTKRLGKSRRQAGK